MCTRAVVGALVACGSIASGAEPEWEPGLNGKYIPFAPLVHSVSDFGAVGDGVTDDAPAFQSAIDNLPATGGAVFVPPGNYLLRSTLGLPSDTVLRGAGAAATHLRFDLGDRPDPAITIITYDRGDWTPAVSGMNRGSEQIVVADASSFEIPTFAEIEQTNDPDLMYTNPEWNQPWAQQAVGEIVRVVGRSGNTLVLERPLHYTYNPSLAPQVRSQGFIENCGIEDLHIERLDTGPAGVILLKNAAWVWIRGVESEMATKYHVITETVYGCEIRQSYFHHAHDYGDGGYAYGVTLQYHTTNCLVEDNIFSNLRHAMMVSLGVSGNVFSYNYSREPTWDSFGNPPDVAMHGHYPFFNLFEGNVVQEVAVADHWGPAGPGNVVFRNCVESEGIWVVDSSHGQEIVGNVLPDGSRNTISIDPSVDDTVVHGNLAGGQIQWDPGIPNHDLPASLYLEGRPWFLMLGAWPPIGSDVGTACLNPAFTRWETGNFTPEATSSLIHLDGFEAGDTTAWSQVQP